MALILNTNIASLNATRNLANTQNQQEVTFKRLSTGLRINSAKDDAAGLYLAQSQTKDIRGLAMATRNAGDGISMAQTAEGALDQIGQNLQRINELAIQSANGTYNTAAREGLQKEVDELSREIFRIVETTEFNGMKLLNQQADNTDLQISFTNENSSRVNVGIPPKGLMQQQGQKIETQEQADKYGLPVGYNLPDLMQFGTGDLASGNALAKILGVSPSTPQPYREYATETNLNHYQKLTGTYDAAPAADGTNKGPDRLELDFTPITAAFLHPDQSTVGKHDAPVFLDDKVFDVVKKFVDMGGNLETGKHDPHDAANLHLDSGGKGLVQRLLDADIADIRYKPNGDLRSTAEQEDEAMRIADLMEAAGEELYRLTSGVTPPVAGTTPAHTAEAFKKLDLAGYQAMKDAYIANDVKVKYDSDIDPITGELMNFPSASLDNTVAMFSVADGLNQSKSINISNVADARMAITQTREAINAVSELRATFGAVMNRFEAVISGNNIYEENLTQARSRIQDTDFAKETANLAKQQVLQQAGIASLSQANQAGQVILNLL